MNLKRYLIAWLSLILLVGQVGNVSAQEKKQVMTTFYPVYYLAKRIAGESADVSMLLDANQDAHDYESSARDAAKVQEADIFIYQDDEMEHFVPDMLKLLDTSKTQIVKSTEGITLLKGSQEEHSVEEAHSEEEHDHDHEHSHEFDPHTWMSPVIYAQQAENVKQALIKADPENQATYEANAEELVKELKALDEEYKTQLANLKNKTIVVQHAAFGYLAHEYGLTQEAITGISSTDEPSATDLAKMQDFVKEHQVTTIYVEPSLNESIAQVVASASGATLRPLRTLESVTQEEMADGVDYFKIMRSNLEELLKN